MNRVMDVLRAFLKKRWLLAILLFLVPLGILLWVPRSERAKQSAAIRNKATLTEPTASAPSRTAWTLAEAKSLLLRQPHDAYLQYVVLQLAHQENQLSQVVQEVPVFAQLRLGKGPDISGSDASLTQGRLQLDTFLKALQPKPLFGSEGNLKKEQARIDWVEPKIPIQATSALATSPSSLTGSWPILGIPFARMAERVNQPGTATRSPDSLPALDWPRTDWSKQLGATKPTASDLARSAPANFWFAEFPSLAKLNDTFELLDRSLQWHSLHAVGESRAAAWTDRLAKQLLFEKSAEYRSFYREILGGIALVGSDLFLGEGSDVSLLITLKQPTLFPPHFENLLKKASDASTRRVQGKYLGVDYTGIVNADRSVSAFGCQPRPNLHVRSNSLVALKRVLEAVKGMNEKGDPTPRLGDAEDYLVFRSQLAGSANEEMGFAFFSDAFLRHQWSPSLQLTHRLRQQSRAHLQMIGYAAQLFRTQTGKAPVSLEELSKGHYVPGEFHQGSLANPFGGTYTLTRDSTAGLCSTVGTTPFLTPCLELPRKSVSEEEAKEYAHFLAEASRSPQGLPAPLAFRISQSGKQLRFDSLAQNGVGGTGWKHLSEILSSPTAMNASPSISAKVQSSLQASLKPEKLEAWIGTWAGKATKTLTSLAKLGLRPHVSVHGYQPSVNAHAGQWLPTLMPTEIVPSSFTWLLTVPTEPIPKSPMFVAIPVADAKVVDDLLTRLDAELPALFTNNRPDFFHLKTSQGLRVRGLSLRDNRGKFYWARLGENLYVANRLDVLEDVYEAVKRGEPRTGTGAPASLRITSRYQEDPNASREVALQQATFQRRACHRNLTLLIAGARAFGATPPVLNQAATPEERSRMVRQLTERMEGQTCTCPDGGTYVLSADGQSFSCTVHGTLDRPEQQEAPSDSSLWVRFVRPWNEHQLSLSLRDGLIQTTVTVQGR